MTADYTPNTDKVRDAYIRGMRTAFIASAGEHHEEFDRWIAKHDAEVAATALRGAANELVYKFGVTNRSAGLLLARAESLTLTSEDPR